MHYRHLFHAGNFADVFKHALLVALLRALNSKEKPWCYVDTHAGAGSYDLGHESAARTAEWRDGVGRIMDLDSVPSALADYVTLLRLAQTPGTSLRYPGSPWFAQQLARSGDRLLLCESQPEIAEMLRREIRGTGIAVHCRDGYEAQALLPPKEKRGLVLIDPPFERLDEFDAVADFLSHAAARFSGGIYAAWYPLKNMRAAERFVRRATRGGEALDLRLDTGASAAPVSMDRARPTPLDSQSVAYSSRNPATKNSAPVIKHPMTACGLLVLNPPYSFEQEAQRVLNALLPVLTRGPRAGVSIERYPPPSA